MRLGIDSGSGEDHAADTGDRTVGRMHRALRSVHRRADLCTEAAQVGHAHGIERHAGRFAVHYRVEHTAERDVHTQIPSTDEDGDRRSMHERGDVGHRNGIDGSRVAVRLEARAGVHRAGWRVEDETLLSITGWMCEREATLESDRRDGDHRVTAHRGISSRVHEHDAGVGLKRRRIDRERSCHVGVAARGVDQRAPVRVGVLETPLTLLGRRLAAWARYAVDDQAQRLTAHVGVNGLDDANHVPRGCRLR